MSRKRDLKQLAYHNLQNRKLVLFGIGVIAKKFYNKYRNELCFDFCISNIPREWKSRGFMEKLDVRAFNKEEISDAHYIVVCNFALFDIFELQLIEKGFRHYDNFLDYRIAEAILSGKKIMSLWGNCILRDIHKCLIEVKEFNDAFATIFTQNKLHQTKYENRVLFYSKEISDYYVYMSRIVDIDNVYHIEQNELPEDCQMIGISNVSCPALWPQTTPLLNYYNEYNLHTVNALYNDMHWHTMYVRDDRNINRLVEEGKSPEEIVQILSDENFYSEKEVKRHFKMAMKSIEIAENDVEIKIADYVKEHIFERKLFQNYIHMNKEVIWEFIRRLFQLLGLPGDSLNDMVKASPEYIHEGGDVPIYPSVQKVLRLSYIKENQEYNIMTYRGLQKMSFAEYVYYYAECVRATKGIQDIWRMGSDE